MLSNSFNPTIILATGIACAVIARLFIWGFDSNDEIYSWNKWAIDHFRNESVDFLFTQSPYPQLFPKILAVTYALIGGLELQTPVKGALAVIPVFALITLAVSWRPERNSVNQVTLLFALLLLLVVYGANLGSRLDDGMPDTLAAAAVLVSLHMLRRFFESRDESFLVLGVICASVGALSKQSAMLWSVSLPLIVLFNVNHKDWNARLIGLISIPLFATGIWLLTEGAGFTNNHGVVQRSIADRNFFDQILHAAKLLGTEYVAVTLLLLWSFYSAVKNSSGLGALLLFAVPSLSLWIIFANYDIRAGMPGTLVLAYIISSNNFGLSRHNRSDESPHRTTSKSALALSLIFLVAGIVASANRFVSAYSEHPSYEIGKSRENNLIRLFGEEAEMAARVLYHDQGQKILTPSNYMFGLVYPSLTVYFPDYNSTWNGEELLRSIQKHSIDLVTTGGRYAYGPGGDTLYEVLSTACEKAFTLALGHNNPSGISIYSVNKSMLAEIPDCLSE